VTQPNSTWRDLVNSAIESSGDPNFRAIADLLRPESLLANPSPTELLSHYTTFVGLNGILSTGRFWATEVAYLNDGSEREYARGVLEAHLREQEARHAGPLLAAALKAARNVLDGSREGYAHFALCFCEKPDLLSMWASYAGRGGGFSLEFEGSAIAELAHRPMGSFVKVAYGNSLANHPMLAGFARSCERIAGADSATVNPEVVGAILAISLDNLFVRVKHPAFFHEEEWRALVRVNIDPIVSSCSEFEFRGADFNVKPYIDLSLPDRGDGPRQLPLRRVTVGPTLRPGETIRAIKWLLRKHGYPDSVVVVPSDIPFRA
jgi:hypothetical protein